MKHAPHRYVLISLFALTFAIVSCRGSEEPSTSSAPSASPAAGEPSVPATGGAGSIEGVIKYDGPPVADHPLEVTKDKEVCGVNPPMDESMMVSGGALANVVVSISDISTSPPQPSQKPQLIQKGCTYLPHVLAIPSGSTLEVLNEDGILHNIHTYSTANPAVNIAQPKFKKVVEVPFPKGELVRVTCDAHGWMSAWLFVASNPFYAVSDKSGHFEIKNVPAGEHTLEAWQEKLGKKEQKVTVKPGEAAKVEIHFAASK